MPPVLCGLKGVLRQMPIYEFECKKCGALMEVFQKINDKHPTKCKKCGGKLEKLLSAPAIQFKGSGWYVTDYSSKGKKEKSEREATTSDTKKSEKSDKTSKESSPAKTSEKSAPKPSAD